MESCWCFGPLGLSHNISNCYEQIKSTLVLFAVRSFEHLCGILKFCQVSYPEGRYPPLLKSASRSTLGVDMQSLEDSVDCATKFAGRHLQDVSCIGTDDISRHCCREHATCKRLLC